MSAEIKKLEQEMLEKLERYIEELKEIANDDEISSESSIALKATELRYMLKGRLLEIIEEGE